MRIVFCLGMMFLAGGMLYCASCCGPDCCKGNQNCCSSPKKTSSSEKTTKELIKEEYSKVAKTDGCCSSEALCCGTGCCGGGPDLSEYLGYTEEELDAIPDANLGLGCGNPVSLGEINKGATILDLGSGAGIDCFLAAKKVGIEGKVIGVDMTEAMIEKARENAINYGIENVEFRLGDIENLPVKNNTINIIISNCVINLANDKLKVFQEAYRVLKPGGKMYVSDVVLLSELSKEQREDINLIAACVGNAILKEEYINKLESAGFTVEIVNEDLDINQTWFGNRELDISSLKFIAHKN